MYFSLFSNFDREYQRQLIQYWIFIAFVVLLYNLECSHVTSFNVPMPVTTRSQSRRLQTVSNKTLLVKTSESSVTTLDSPRASVSNSFYDIESHGIMC